MKKIVVIGGGTGTYTVLTGLKTRSVELTAVVSMADSGGSSGRLRDELGILPPGDVRRCLLALASDEVSQTLRNLFAFRFENGQELKNHSFGNLFLAALTEITGREDLAISEAAKVLQVRGQVLPVSLTNTHLWARLEDGTVIKGETNIDIRRVKPQLKIEEVFLKPPAEIYAPVAEALAAADLIVIGPGDLYTSIIPNLLVRGIDTALLASSAPVVYVVNIMTKHGETTGFAASDFAREIVRYLGRKLDFLVVNRFAKPIPPRLRDRYQEEKAAPVTADVKRCSDYAVKVVGGNLVSAKSLLRHDPVRLAETILELC